MRRGTKIALGIAAPVVVIGIVLGVLFGLRKGGGNSGGEETPQGGDDIVKSIITASPSGMPSVKVTEAPVEQCPIGQKEFILKYSNRGNDDSEGRRLLIGGSKHNKRSDNAHLRTFQHGMSRIHVQVKK